VRIASINARLALGATPLCQIVSVLTTFLQPVSLLSTASPLLSAKVIHLEIVTSILDKMHLLRIFCIYLATRINIACTMTFTCRLSHSSSLQTNVNASTNILLIVVKNRIPRIANPMKFVILLFRVAATAMTLVPHHTIVLQAFAMRIVLILDVLNAQIAQLDHIALCKPKTQ